MRERLVGSTSSAFATICRVTSRCSTRDFDAYLYDPTFSSVRIRFEGPWDDTGEHRRAVEVLVDDVRVENGVRLLVINLELPGDGMLARLEDARSQVQRLLGLLPAS